MRQVFYIEADEEIISAIGSLRRSRARENVFVFPKSALILRSLVNVRLLAKEAQRMNKQITVVTTDEAGRSLAEKAGLVVRSYIEESREEQTAGARALEDDSVSTGSRRDATAVDAVSRSSQSMGSANFFAPGSKPSHQRAGESGVRLTDIAPRALLPVTGTEKDMGERLPVRDRTPKHLTALNSQSQSVPSAETLMPTIVPDTSSESSHPEHETDVVQRFQSNTVTPVPEASLRPTRPLFVPSGPVSERDANIKKIFNQNTQALSATSVHLPQSFLSAAENVSNPTRPVSSLTEKRRRLRWAKFMGVIVLAVGAGYGAWWAFAPEAHVIVTPKLTTIKQDARFEAGAGKELPTRTVELEHETVKGFSASGTSALADQKAKGTIIIANEYSVESQTLVATTRFLSADGKLFRLRESITVPGLQSSGGTTRPGIIEAVVVADQAGESYNIGPSIFTIPGFQGGPKYAKFTARSTKAFSGGGSTVSTVATVTQADILKAKQETEALAFEEAFKRLESQLKSGEKLLPEAADRYVLASLAVPPAGVAAGQFDYRVTLKVKALVFSETDLKALLVGRMSGVPKEEVERMQINYTRTDASFETNVLTLQVTGAYDNTVALDVEGLKRDLAGKNETEIEMVLATHPEVESIEIQFSTLAFGNRIPVDPRRVHVELHQ